MWNGLAQDRNRRRALVNAVMNLRLPLNDGRISSGFVTGGLSSSVQFHRVKCSGYCMDLGEVGWGDV
jgi:hypothetical protein